MSHSFAKKMYALEEQLENLNTKLWSKFEEESGDVWEELNNAQNWEQAYRKDPDMCHLMKQKLQSYLLM